MLRNPEHLALKTWSRNTSPHGTGLWWCMGLDTRESWSPQGGQTPVVCGGQACSAGLSETQHRNGTVKDLLAVGSVPEGQKSERTLSGEERVSGWRFPRPPSDQLPRSLWELWNSLASLLVTQPRSGSPLCTAQPGLLSPAVGHHCWLAGRGQPCPKWIPAEAPQVTGRRAVSLCWQTGRKSDPPPTAQQ